MPGRRTSTSPGQICHLITPCTRNSQKSLYNFRSTWQEGSGHWLYQELEQMCQQDNTKSWAVSAACLSQDLDHQVVTECLFLLGIPRNQACQQGRSSISQKNRKVERHLIENGLLRARRYALSNHTALFVSETRTQVPWRCQLLGCSTLKTISGSSFKTVLL